MEMELAPLEGWTVAGGFLTILPLAVVMVAGPQTISAVFLATGEAWRRTSTAYVAGAAASITLLVTIACIGTRGARDAAGRSHRVFSGDVADIVVLALMATAMVLVFMRRGRPDPPRWMRKLGAATPAFAFALGFVLLGLFPVDLVTSISVGAHLAREGKPWYEFLPFLCLTLLLLAVPALVVAMFGARATTFLPKARDWMNSHSWIVSEIVLVFFIVMTVRGLLS